MTAFLVDQDTTPEQLAEDIQQEGLDPIGIDEASPTPEDVADRVEADGRWAAEQAAKAIEVLWDWIENTLGIDIDYYRGLVPEGVDGGQFPLDEDGDSEQELAAQDAPDVADQQFAEGGLDSEYDEWV